MSDERPARGMLLIVLRLSFGLALLVVPFLVPLYLPLQLVPLYWVAAMIIECVEDRLFGEVNHTFLWMLGACWGLSYATAQLVPWTILSLIAGLACFVVLLWLQTIWEKFAKLRIVRKRPGPRLTETEPVPFTGTSAWGGPAPVTPEGETLRVLSCGEFAMGGPVICDYLFADGSVILGAGASTGFSPDGRYFVSPSPSREKWSLLLFDRHHRLLYRCHEANAFWEIDLVGDNTVTGRRSPLTSNQTYTVMIDDLITSSSPERLVCVADLWIPEGDWQYIRMRQDVSCPSSPPGGPVLAATPYLPPSLMALEAPLDPLYYPKAELFVDGVASGLLIATEQAEFAWRQDAGAFVCEATPKSDGGEAGYWLWVSSSGWRRIPPGRGLQDDIPYAARDKFAGLGPESLTVQWSLSQPRLSHDDFGQLDGYTHSALEIDGRLHPQPIVRQHVLLDEVDPDRERLESEPLRNGLTLSWRYLRTDMDLSRHVYSCAFGDHPLDGEWLLDHRLSANRTHAALVAYDPAPSIPHRIGVLNAETGSVEWVEETFYLPQLQAFSDHALYLVHMEGRIDVSPDDGPGTFSNSEEAQRLSEIRPPLDQARTFLAHRADSRLQYRRAAVTGKDDRWQAIEPKGWK
ncbi:hypothetical protein [Sinorhizobium sp. RAC02]|uniref:hypothetical protein n=1 Tax=Sinorhizobium sp. RAC02 TaxID=1842534 RepID=UPI0008592203|nr:hypothetical protein [Sinorhizobium sp. RAC02]AOF94085.1 hypothetical protein BSY16_4154 [Sinorhizobium sp. RAC02]